MKQNRLSYQVQTSVTTKTYNELCATARDLGIKVSELHRLFLLEGLDGLYGRKGREAMWIRAAEILRKQPSFLADSEQSQA